MRPELPCHIGQERVPASFRRVAAKTQRVPWLHLVIQSIAGTVIASASVEINSIEALSDSAALYLAAKSTTTVARGKLQHTSASRANGLTTRKVCSRTNRTADCTLTRAKEPTNTVGERRPVGPPKQGRRQKLPPRKWPSQSARNSLLLSPVNGFSQERGRFRGLDPITMAISGQR